MFGLGIIDPLGWVGGYKILLSEYKLSKTPFLIYEHSTLEPREREVDQKFRSDVSSLLAYNI